LKKKAKKRIKESFIACLEKENFLGLWLDALRDSHSKKSVKGDGEVSSEKVRRSEMLRRLLPAQKDQLVEMLKLCFDHSEQMETLKFLNPIRS